jgi:hypothetical protein
MVNPGIFPQTRIINRGGIHRPRNGQRHHLRRDGVGRTDTHVPTLRPSLQSQAMLSLQQLRPHRYSVRRSSNMRLLRRATRDQALQAERSRRIHS